MSIRVGIDVGGTFTDVTAFDDDKAEVALIRKYTSDAAHPMRVMDAITRDLAKEFGGEAVTLILHGSTAALNTLLEDKGVRVGLITTAGFRDVYEIGRQWRGEEVFNLFAPAPKMLLGRDDIFEVRERLDFRGDVVTPLDRADVEHAARALLARGVEAVAIAFLFAYTSPRHEQEAADIIRSIAPGLYVSLSSEVNPEWREYERTASTVANAYIGPPVAHYLAALEELSRARFPRARALMMKSDGGAAGAAQLSRTPIQTVMSGPVAGVIGSRYLGDLLGIANLITFDTGGTSSDMAVLPGAPLYKSEVSVGRHPVRTRAVDIDTIGAGGGSIASIAPGGVLKVGPRSAGADPGPACYGRGGSEPTLTDALVVLGHLSDTALLGGAMPISRNAAWRAIEDHIAAPLKMDLREAAWGVLTVLATNCMSAMRTITVERGFDPREFTLVAFGGMGPTIAGRVAAELGIGRILVPRDPGAFSAWGMLVTDVHQEHGVTRITPLDEATPEAVEALFAGLERQGIDDLLRETFSRERIHTLRTAGMRYRGQSYEVSVPVGAVASRGDLDKLAQVFHAAHRRRYGHMAENEAIEIVNFKVTAVGEIAKPRLAPARVEPGAPARPIETRQAYFGSHGLLDTAIFRRAGLAPGAALGGPAIIEEQTSTTVLGPGHRARVDEYLNIVIDLGAPP
jgi:N-methylhydantoinase A